MNEETTWANDRRLELVVDKALNDARNQWEKLIGKDRLALQMEWVEFLSEDWSDLTVLTIQFFVVRSGVSVTARTHNYKSACRVRDFTVKPLYPFHISLHM